jgi:hypothetical protein
MDRVPITEDAAKSNWTCKGPCNATYMDIDRDSDFRFWLPETPFSVQVDLKTLVFSFFLPISPRE